MQTQTRSKAHSHSISLNEHGSNTRNSLSEVGAEESGRSSMLNKPNSMRVSIPGMTTSHATEKETPHLAEEKRQLEKIMIRRRGFEANLKQRADTFQKTVMALLKKNNKGVYKDMKKQRKAQDKEKGESISLPENHELEPHWNKSLPVLQAQPQLMNDIVEKTAFGYGASITTLPSSSAIWSTSTLNIDDRTDKNAPKDYYSSVKKKETGIKVHNVHPKNPPLEGSIENEVNKYPFRDLQYRIAEEEAIKSDEDVTIRGRRKARKNKLILTMIRETDSYLLRETADNNRRKIERRQESEKAKKMAREKDEESAMVTKEVN